MIDYKSEIHPSQMFTTLWSNRDLFFQLVKRDILAKYRGSLMGVVWLLLSPLLMLSLYTIVFGVFMNVHWPNVDNNLMYSLIIYIGLIILNFFSECISRSPTLITSNPNFVKKVMFPLEIYPWVIVCSALFHTLINSIILSLFCLLLLGKIYLTIFFLPILFIPLIFITLGISWFLCSTGVFVKDTSHIMVFIMQIIMYLSPVFYSISTLPQKYQKILLINPLTFIIEQARSSILFGKPPHWSGFFIYCIVSLGIAWLGFVWFQKTKRGFADVL